MRYLLLLGSVLVAFSCSGGGGGGEDSAGRTRETAIRMMHGIFDETPVDLVVDGVTLQRVSFMQPMDYIQIEQGARIIQAVSGRGEILGTISGNLEDDTEYTLLLSGQIEDGSERLTLITDTVQRPEEGLSNFRLYSAFDSARISVGGVSLSSNEGTASRNIEGTSEVTQYSLIVNGLASVKPIVVPDRGDVSFFVAGSNQFGFSESVLFQDLD